MNRVLSVALVAALSVPVAGPVLAARPEPPWLDAVEALDGAMSTEVVDQRARWIDWRARFTELPDWNGPYDLTPRPPAGAAGVPPGPAQYGPDVERWRPLVATFFLADDVPWAMRVLECESHGDPLAKNPRSSASGLFQHLASYWPERAEQAGWPLSDVYDPVANVAVAAWLYYMDGPDHWVCR